MVLALNNARFADQKPVRFLPEVIRLIESFYGLDERKERARRVLDQTVYVSIDWLPPGHGTGNANHTGLFCAYKMEDNESLQMLLRAGADVNQQYEGVEDLLITANTLLHMAIQHKRWDVARAFVLAGADVNFIRKRASTLRKRDSTPLSKAIDALTYDNWQMLRRRGFDDLEDLEAIHFAKFLVAHGAKVTERFYNNRMGPLGKMILHRLRFSPGMILSLSDLILYSDDDES